MRSKQLTHGVAALWCALASGAPVSAEPDEAEEEDVSFVGEATVGANLYDISAPFNDSSVSGFFDQWRYVENKEARPPFYVDLLHLDVGARRKDGTYLTRLELWSPNLLNERGLLELDWRGIGLEVNSRRYRADQLRAFPTGTGDGLGRGETPGYGSIYFPDTPNAQIFDANKRFWIRRQGMDGTLSLGFDDMGWSNPALEKVSLYGDYQVRDGYRQDSFLDPDQQLGSFRGERSRVDQEIATVGVGALTFPSEWFTANLDVKLQQFTERAPQDIEFGARPNYVPNTNRILARLDASKVWKSANLTLGGFVTHLEQTGGRSPVQEAFLIDENQVTSYSVWSSFDADLPSIFDLTGYAKWSHRHHGIGPDFQRIQISSPYVRSTGALKANLEFGARPVSGTRVALGYRADYVNRKLRFSDSFFAVGPGASSLRPTSLHHFFYLSGRTRLLRGLNLQGELGFDWGPEVGYPDEFEEAIYFSGRGSYTLPTRLPVVLAVAGRVIDGKSPGYEFDSSKGLAGFGNSRVKTYDRLAWNYDVTVSVVPIPKLAVFTTFAQHSDTQQLRHLRVTGQRGFVFSDYFIDSIPSYWADIESLSVGGTFLLSRRVELSAAASLTWTGANFRRDSSTGVVLSEANEIDNRIVGFESDVDYEVVEGLALGIGYRLAQYEDREVQEFLDYSGTVHTVTLRMTIDLAALPSLLP